MMSSPTYSMIKDAFSPGDVIYVLTDGRHFKPVKILLIERKRFVTEIGEVLYEDHGWLWRALKPKEE